MQRFHPNYTIYRTVGTCWLHCWTKFVSGKENTFTRKRRRVGTFDPLLLPKRALGKKVQHQNLKIKS